MIRVAVVGAGHFGRKHAQIYASSTGAALVAVCDIDESNGEAVAELFAADFMSDFRELIGRVDAVSIAVPTISHHAIACELLEAGISVLMEKPISATLDEAEQIIAAAERGRAALQIGHLERFNPAVTAASAMVTKPLFFEAHRLSIFSARSLDIDVVMDLMIHDLDVVLSFVESEVREVRAAGVPILTSKVDIANARIEFENGCVANLTASRVSSEHVRKLRFFQPHEYVSIDYSAQEAAVVSVKPGVEGKPSFDSRSLQIDREEPLRLEIESFLRAVEGEPVRVSGEDGRRALALAVEITKKIREHAGRAGVSALS